ncbi:DNA polymerase LigD family protein [Mycobacterium xenopi 4042]|uniref:DNA polymerase LigD family protein n=1 Tax=Mycobacterium xenopi 4042 TaxID=1299334 RepID=X7ZJM7_MYCXE|nr:DNA polymerase LigD family protein [Mycobacterium xenopi 4042]
MPSAAEELDVDGITVRLTNPDRIYFPKLGSAGTKRRLVEYYRAVAPGPMLTALRDRPTHLQRFPDGIDGEEIYQKRIPQHHPDYLETCRVTFPSGRTADALKVTHPAAIVWAAQMGTVTLHPWPVRCPDTEHPDELRIDLDPQPGTGFAEARAIAVDVLKPLLDELGLVGYPKTSGGRACTYSCGSKPTGISSPYVEPGLPWPARWNAAHRTPSRPRGGKRSAESASSSTTTRTPATARSRRHIRCGGRRSRRYLPR